MMDNRITIDLSIVGSQIDAKACMVFDKPVDTIRFSINALLEITCISSPDTAVSWHISRKWQPLYRAECNEICVEGKAGFTQLTVEYRGPVSGWCNVVGDDLIALSFYSAWHPQEASVPIESPVVRIHGMREYDVVHARYDASSGVWIYGESSYDAANIVALKKNVLYTCGEDGFRYCSTHPEDRENAESIARCYKDVRNYYNHELYSPKETEGMTIVSLGLPEANGAYFRKGLIVISNLDSLGTGETQPRLIHAYLMAHELGHAWCNGADTRTWEDWLNETTAEWSALLYALARDDKALFDHILRFRLEQAQDAPPIRTADGSRPDGVHSKGTALFYEIYKKFGRGVVETMVRTFVYLDVKTTESYIGKLKETVGNEVAGVVERGLDIENLSCLAP